MKIYIYFSKNKISKINDVNFVKDGIARSITEAFSLFETVQASDISIRCAKISNDIDVFLVIDSAPLAGNSETAVAMNKIKETVKNIVQADQSCQISYKVTYKIEKNHAPMGTEYLGGAAVKSSNDSVQSSDGEEVSELDYASRAKAYVPVEPAYSFDRVILPDDVLEKIESAINILRYERKVFQEWGLYEIQPNPSSALSFFGPSGTGKTMAAEAIAEKLGKKILKVSYADVESKYHGEGPKMVKAIFMAAEKEDAVLFFDEADSFLGKRIQNVNQSADQALNSLRSQMLILLEEHSGVVIFATNLVSNFDKAFQSRILKHIKFDLPNEEARIAIIRKMIPSKLPLAGPLADSELKELGEMTEGFSGREIKNAILDILLAKASEDKENAMFTFLDFKRGFENKKKEMEALKKEMNGNKLMKIKKAFVEGRVEPAKEETKQDHSSPEEDVESSPSIPKE